MSEYKLYLTLHVLAVIAWLGSALCVQVLAFRAVRTGDPARQQLVADDAEWLAARIFIPSSIAVLVFGSLLVIEIPGVDLGTTWVLLGLLGYAFSFLTGILFLSPESGRIKKLLAAGDMTAAKAKMDRILLVSRVELLILFLVAVDMTTKPG